MLQVVHFVGGEFPAEVDYHGNFPPAPGCPFVWDGFVLELPPFAGERGLARVKLELREGDGTTRLVGRWCWDSLHNGACGPIPAEFLIAGELDAPELHVEFERITSQ